MSRFAEPEGAYQDPTQRMHLPYFLRVESEVLINIQVVTGLCILDQDISCCLGNLRR